MYRKSQKGGDATSLPYEFYNPLAGDFPSNSPIGTPFGNLNLGNQTGGGATNLPFPFYNPIAENDKNGFFCGEPNNYLDFFYRGACARNNARKYMNDGPVNPQGLTLTGWQAPNSIPAYTGNQKPMTVQELRQCERSILAPQGYIVKPNRVQGVRGIKDLQGVVPQRNIVKQQGGGTFGAPFANNAFGCGPNDSPNSGLSYRFNECDLQTGVTFVPIN